MKSLVRFGSRMLLTGAAIAGTTLGLALPARALPEAAVLQKLETIVMYMLITADGDPILARVQSAEGGATEAITGVFVSPSDAENVILARRQESLDLLKEEQAKPNKDDTLILNLENQAALWQGATILPIGLDQVYQFDKNDDANNLNFQFFPTGQQLANASQILPEGASLSGVPLFFLSVQTTNEAGDPITVFPTSPELNPALTPETYPTCDQDGQRTPQVEDNCTVLKVPVFFEAEPILSQIEAAENKEQLSISLISLENFINRLSDNNLPAEEQSFLQEMSLIPSRESAELLQRLIDSSNGTDDPAANPTP